jgi:hypothetical protein
LFADFWQYDPVSDTWIQKADFAGGARYATSGFSIGSYGYVGTGTDFTGGGFTFRNDFWQYDPVSDTWIQKADFAGGARELAVGFSINNKGYIGTGLGASDFWEYDPTLNIWTRKADFGGGGRNMSAGFTVGGKGYLGTGDGGGLHNDLWEYTGEISSCLPPDIPTITATSNPVCLGSTTTLSISSGNHNNATAWKWYTGSCGGTLVGTGNSITVTPSAATTYYVRGEGGCSAPGECASITINMGSVNVIIPDAKTLNYNSIAKNTVYPAYSPGSSITLTAQASGIAPYSYFWSNGSATQTITVSPTTTATYTVTVTDGNGCVGMASKEIKVKDVNCSNGKIYICHIAGNSGHVNTICIDNSAVATHLSKGCSLGQCVAGRSTQSITTTEASKLSIQILPNPSNNYFIVTIKSSDNSPVSIKVMDIQGKAIEQRTNIKSGDLIFTDKFSAGVYVAEIIQGSNRKFIQFVKQ